MNWLLVFLGGGLGSLARFAIGQWLAPFSFRFPLATLLANGLACLVFGAVFSIFEKNGWSSSPFKIFWLAGFCGGFSTFSTFSGETIFLFQTGQTGLALANVFGNLAVCLAFLLLGIKM